MIFTATFPVGPSASLTIPYVPAPRVRPNRYLDLLTGQHILARGKCCLLLIIAFWLAVQLVEHGRDWKRHGQHDDRRYNNKRYEECPASFMSGWGWLSFANAEDRISKALKMVPTRGVNLQLIMASNSAERTQ
jgi:hypothetical protein